MSEQDVQIVLLKGPYRKNGVVRGEISLRIDGTDRHVVNIRLDSDREWRRLTKQWSEAYNLDQKSLDEKARAATVAVAAKLKERGVTDEDGAIEASSYVDESLIVELAWNWEQGRPDFVQYDRKTSAISRDVRIETPSGILCPPSCWRGIVTPGWPIDGSVLVPTEFDETGLDEDRLREDVQGFVHRYVELPADTEKLCVEYILMTWLYDAFSELPYLCFRTADLGRGKSRAQLTIGALCYRPMLAGGGSTAAALRRILDLFRGTLVCDEFDAGKDTELTSTVSKILNQGFEHGRPMLLCEGESNAPRPYYIFGPKVFVLRKKLGDDASESRTISVWMKQRTRADVPINLPKAVFYPEALALRNRLLAWRCAKLGEVAIDPALADDRLEDRLNQIGAALFAVADESGRDCIVRALLAQQREIAADRADSIAGEVFEAAKVVIDGVGIVRPGEVAKEINRNRAAASGVDVDKLGNRGVNPWKVGRLLSGILEFRRDGKDEKGARYRLDEDRRHQLELRFGGVSGETSETSKRQLSSERSAETRPVDSASAVSDVPDVSDVPGEVPEVDDSDRLEREAIMATEAEEVGRSRSDG